MQLVGHVSYNLAPIISLFLKRDVNKVLVGKKLIVELDMDLRSRVSTSLTGQTFARKSFKVWPARLCEYHL